jgi:hypothetical protein
MGRSGAALSVVVCLAFGGLVPAASAQTGFHPRMGTGLGLFPPVNATGKQARADIATGALTPVTYHGGSVMAGGVTVHTIFWAPSGYAFQGSPGGSVPSYEGLLKQFFGDVAHDSGANGGCSSSGCNAFTVLPQYAQGTSVGQITPGSYAISYSATGNSIDDTNPYPAKASQCASPSGVATCITDGQIQAEIDRLIQSTPGTPRGLGNLWYVFLPPGVDECVTAAGCGTNAFVGYHSVSNVNGHGVTIYAVSIDPIIEGPVGPGADPNGYPDAETTVDVAAHETVEAVTDPEGTGYMDPNGFETGDKCESGPQVGQPLGFAANGSPYNQVINGHQYLLQEMWANLDSGANSGCVQATTTTTNQLPLPQVNLRQFNSVVTGNVNRAAGGGIGVQVTLLRASAVDGRPVVVARSSTTTAGNGSWSVSLAPHAVGDDRDEIDIDYSGAGAPQPTHQVIQTGNGGNPFTESGWTGWFALDNGSAAANGSGGSSLTLAPCFQAGVLSYTFDGTPSAESLTDFCNTQTDTAIASTAVIRPGDTLTASSNDNRAFSAPAAPTPNLLGGLVSLTARVGEPGSLSPYPSPLADVFTPTGMPQCLADLEVQAVACVGLVPKQTYMLTDGRQRTRGVADPTGTVVVALKLARGDAVGLSNGSRSLTTLHVAHLQVAIGGEQTVLLGGTCQPGAYYGVPPSSAPTGTPAGLPTSASTGGSALTGAICPISGDATGLPTATIVQTDELSGGATETEVPDIQNTSPMQGETMYGKFTALAESGLIGPFNTLFPTDQSSMIGLSIVPSSGRSPVFTARNVDTPTGVAVPALTPGTYTAAWTLSDANGDLRFLDTRFVEQVGPAPAGAKAKVACKLVGSHHGQIRCTVTFPSKRTNGTVRLRITRAGSVVALGNGKVKTGSTTITMRRLRRVSKGAWRITLVLSQPHKRAQTIVLAPKKVV